MGLVSFPVYSTFLYSVRRINAFLIRHYLYLHILVLNKCVLKTFQGHGFILVKSETTIRSHKQSIRRKYGHNLAQGAARFQVSQWYTSHPASSAYAKPTSRTLSVR